MRQSQHRNPFFKKLQSFAGLLNLADHYTAIEDNELLECINFYIEPGSGRLAIRYGISKYWSGAALAAEITGLHYYIKDSTHLYKIAVADNKLYSFDGTSATLIGSLTGTERPTFYSNQGLFGGKLYIASGGDLQSWDGTTLSAITGTGHPHPKYIDEADGRLMAAGDSTYMGRVYFSGVNDPTIWNTIDPGNPGQYFDVCGYITSISTSFGAEHVLVFDGRGNEGIYRLDRRQAIVETPKRGSTSISQHAIVTMANDLLFADNDAFKSLAATQGYGDLGADPTDRKVNSLYNVATTAVAFYYPEHNQVWFNPDTTGSYCYVYHIFPSALETIQGSWSRFKFASSLKVTAGLYIPSLRELWIGMSDGRVYKYDSGTYADNDVSFEKEIRFKQFDFENPIGRNVLKKVEFLVERYNNGRLLVEVSRDLESFVQIGGFTLPEVDFNLYRINQRVTGNLIQLRLTSSDDASFAINSITLEGARLDR